MILTADPIPTHTLPNPTPHTTTPTYTHTHLHTHTHSYKEVILTADLIDRARPGEDIEVTGVYKYRADPGGFNARNGFPVFSTCIEVREWSGVNVMWMQGERTDQPTTATTTDDGNHTQ